MKTIVIGFIGALVMAGVALAQSGTPPEGPAKLELDEQAPVGSYLTDEQGRSLYMFKADGKNLSNCYDACAQAWPPLLSEGQPEAGEGIDPKLLGSTERKDGSQQATYNGWPLYYFIKDQQPGDIKGQDVEGFGAEWYLLDPRGQVAGAEGQAESKG